MSLSSPPLKGSPQDGQKHDRVWLKIVHFIFTEPEIRLYDLLSKCHCHHRHLKGSPQDGQKHDRVWLRIVHFIFTEPEIRLYDLLSKCHCHHRHLKSCSPQNGQKHDRAWLKIVHFIFTEPETRLPTIYLYLLHIQMSPSFVAYSKHSTSVLPYYSMQVLESSVCTKDRSIFTTQRKTCLTLPYVTYVISHLHHTLTHMALHALLDTFLRSIDSTKVLCTAKGLNKILQPAEH